LCKTTYDYPLIEPIFSYFYNHMITTENRNMRTFCCILLVSFIYSIAVNAQKPSAEILAQINKLNTVGSVLYIAAHPDDENNSFLPYLTKQRMFRTAYLSLTRGDGGQNLIGKEQGIELGMIRTQELLAARRIDGAEQYFSTAYEFGFSKSSEEALRIWDHDKVLSDAVLVIRKFQPDIIITRFPRDARAGHGHHSASAIIANEAFIAAADPNKFPEQFKLSLVPWKAKRILWNTFNFGSVNTTNDNQLKLEVGGYNAVLGKSYGEIGAEARTMHKSQGEGRPRRRGAIYEFFELTGGEAAKNDIMDGVNLSWSKVTSTEKEAKNIEAEIDAIASQFKTENPAASVSSLVKLYKHIQVLPASTWRNYKLEEVKDIIKDAAGLFFEATSQQQQVVQGDNVKMQFLVNQRSAVNSIVSRIQFPQGVDSVLNKPLVNNQNIPLDFSFKVPTDFPISQPYWLVKPKTEGMFMVTDPQLIGEAQNEPAFKVGVVVTVDEQVFNYTIPVQYKVTDPTKGDVYQPLVVVPNHEIKYDKEVYLKPTGKSIAVGYQSLQDGSAKHINVDVQLANAALPTSSNEVYTKSIQYDHIPTLTYFPPATATIMESDVKTRPAKVGYIDGAGDKLPEALIELGYQVTMLKEADINLEKLKQFDAVVVGIRAYNMLDYLTDKNEIINAYIEQGGNWVVQYLKSNQVGLKKVKVGPYAFTVNAGKRVTQEEAPVQLILPNHSVLNIPNAITSVDFDHWVQERSTYQAESIDAHFETPLAMSDKGEPISNGSLLIAPYGKGNMVYLSLVLFRQLPAGNPGAYKLLSNIISLPKH
jgi:LmbE family N-acetylglucosaminyl deacetylase